MWTIKIGGVKYPAKINSIVEELNGDEKATFTFYNNPKTRSLLTSNQNVIIQFFNRDIYKGVLTGGKYYQDSIKCKVYNRVFYNLNKKTHTHNYNNVAGNIILSGIANDAGINYGSSPSGINFKVNFDFTNCVDAVKYLAESADLDFYATGFNTIEIGSRGTDKGSFNDLTISNRGVDRFKSRNKVRIRGQDSSGARIYGLAGVSGTTIVTGVANEAVMSSNEVVFTDKRSRSISELNTIAKNKLEKLKSDTDSMQINVPINEGYKIFPGDTITISDDLLNLNGSYRVWKTIKNENNVVLELDKPSNLIQKELINLKGLEDYGIYQIAASQIADKSIDTQHIADEAIDTDQIKAYAITSDKINAQAITSDKLTSNQIYGKDIRTAENVGAGVDGVKFTADGIEGWGGGDLQFSLSSSDGKAKAGAGKIELNKNGLIVRDYGVALQDQNGNPRASLGAYNTTFWIIGNLGSLIKITSTGNNIELKSGDDILLNPAGSLKMNGNTGITSTIDIVASGGGYYSLDIYKGIIKGI